MRMFSPQAEITENIVADNSNEGNRCPDTCHITIKESLMITGAKKLLMSILAVVIMCGFVVGCSGSGSSGNPSGSSDTVVPVNSGTGSLSGSGK